MKTIKKLITKNNALTQKMKSEKFITTSPRDLKKLSCKNRKMKQATDEIIKRFAR